MLGVSLQADDAMTARRAYEEMVDRVALQGDTEKSFSGLISYPGIASSSAAATWLASVALGTPAGHDAVLKTINDLLIGTATATLYTSVADTLLMSPERMNLLATTRLGDTLMTLLEFIRKNNTYTAMTGRPLDIKGVRGLSTAGAGTTQRMVAYRKAPDVLKLHIPMPHRFLPVYQDGPLHWVVPGVFRLGGLDVRRPNEVRYLDNI